MDPDTAAGLLATGGSVSGTVVGTLPRGLFSTEVTLMLLRSLPPDTRVSGASEVVSSLVAKIMSTRGPKIRGLAINTIRAIVIEFLVTPTPLPRFNMTRAEYYTLAPCWGRSTPCLNRVGSSSSHPETHDYDRFRRWHLHSYCGVAGDLIAVDWLSFSDVLIRRFCTMMTVLAVREAGYPSFPSELVEMVARRVASPHRVPFPFCPGTRKRTRQ